MNNLVWEEVLEIFPEIDTRIRLLDSRVEIRRSGERGEVKEVFLSWTGKSGEKQSTKRAYIGRDTKLEREIVIL